MQQWHKEPRPETATATRKQENAQQGKCQRGPETDHSAGGDIIEFEFYTAVVMKSCVSCDPLNVKGVLVTCFVLVSSLAYSSITKM
jgi:hypothetical protein